MRNFEIDLACEFQAVGRNVCATGCVLCNSNSQFML